MIVDGWVCDLAVQGVREPRFAAGCFGHYCVHRFIYECVHRFIDVCSR